MILLYHHKNECVLGFLTLIYGLISFAETSGDVSAIEKSILDYHHYTGESIWKWNSSDVKLAATGKSNSYNFICSPGFHFSAYFNIETEYVMLESQDCTRIRMEIFKCSCERAEKEDGATVTHVENYKLARGVNGEIYEVASPREETICRDLFTFVVKRCVGDGADIPLDVSDIEMMIQKNRDVLRAQEWDSPDSTCKLLNPDSSEARVDTMAIILEASNCAQIHMKVLHCDRDGQRTTKRYIRGKNMEVYEVARPEAKTKCKEPEVLTVKKRFIDHKGNLVQPVCPK